MIDIERVSDVDLLRQVARVQDAEIRRLHQLIDALSKSQGKDAAEQIALLRERLENNYDKTFGRGSERRPRDEEESEKKPKEPQQGHGPTPQPELPIEDRVHVLDKADCTCPECGGKLRERSGQFVDSEEIDVVEIQYVKKRHRRQKYRCCECGHDEVALGPTKLIPGGRYSLGFAVHVVLAKFADSLPFERQVRRMRRAGLEATSQSLWDQSWALCCLLQSAVERLHQKLLAEPVVIVDETRWPLLGAKGRKKTKNWFVWALTAKGGVVYRIQKTRSIEAGRELLRDFAGTAVADGYVVYESIAKDGSMRIANDWCHVRRKFIEAEVSSSNAVSFLDDIGELFKIEREINERVVELEPIAANELRAQIRDEKSRPIVRRIGERAATVRAMADSPIATALKYMANRWDGLKVFLDDPLVPITSNKIEGLLRTVVLGRVNALGSRSERGIKTAETFYTLIETAKLNGVDPGVYLQAAVLAALRGETVPLPDEIA